MLRWQQHFLSTSITALLPIIFAASNNFRVYIFCSSSFGTHKGINNPVAVCVCMCGWLVVYTSTHFYLPVCVHSSFCHSSVHVCLCTKTTLSERTGHLGETPTTEMSHLPIMPPSNTEEREEIWNASILLMSKASVWELRVLKEWKNDLRGKTKTEKKRQKGCFSVFKISRAACTTSQPRRNRN